LRVPGLAGRAGDVEGPVDPAPARTPRPCCIATWIWCSRGCPACMSGWRLATGMA